MIKKSRNFFLLVYNKIDYFYKYYVNLYDFKVELDCVKGYKIYYNVYF